MSLFWLLVYGSVLKIALIYFCKLLQDININKYMLPLKYFHGFIIRFFNFFYRFHISECNHSQFKYMYITAERKCTCLYRSKFLECYINFIWNSTDVIWNVPKIPVDYDLFYFYQTFVSYPWTLVVITKQIALETISWNFLKNLIFNRWPIKNLAILVENYIKIFIPFILNQWLY